MNWSVCEDIRVFLWHTDNSAAASNEERVCVKMSLERERETAVVLFCLSLLRESYIILWWLWLYYDLISQSNASTECDVMPWQEMPKIIEMMLSVAVLSYYDKFILISFLYLLAVRAGYQFTFLNLSWFQISANYTGKLASWYNIK